jgi:hypothetical protein
VLATGFGVHTVLMAPPAASTEEGVSSAGEAATVNAETVAVINSAVHTLRFMPVVGTRMRGNFIRTKEKNKARHVPLL